MQGINKIHENIVLRTFGAIWYAADKNIVLLADIL